MLAQRGVATRLEARQLALQPSDLQFFESLAPLLGNTPRRVKRFVNGLQLLLAMPPTPGVGGQPPEGAIVAFLAAVNAGLPELARDLFVAITAGSTGSLPDVLARLKDPPENERARLKTWLEAPEREAWRQLEVKRLRPRLSMISRLSFERDPVLN